jgi:N-methylhydantoinase A/oxoprolinase/acetone carboxylase beta subunit
VAFGGAGPLHACALADALGMPVAIIPPRAGVLSAVGLLAAAPTREVVRSRAHPSDLSTLDADVERVAADARALLRGSSPAAVTTSLDCRYAGQSHELTVGDLAGFHAEHRLRNGFARPDAPVEVVAVRATLAQDPVLRVADLPVPAHRASFEPVEGPRVIAEPDCTIWLAEGWAASAGAGGALLLERVDR